MIKTVLIALSALVTIGSAVPYVIEIIKGKTKPRIVSWFTWSLLTGIACAASFADHEYATGILLVFATLETLSVVVLGLRHGDRHVDRFDVMCQIAALVGLTLWLLFNSPAIAVIASVTIDFIGALPTFKHAWQKPYEETAITFAMSGFGGLCTLLIVGSWKVTAVAYPLYLLAVNVLLTGVILSRLQWARRGLPAALRDL